MDIQEQLIELQMRLAYQEDLLNALNEMITEQDKDILFLKRQCLQWEERFKAISESADGRSTLQERPPHY